MDDKNSEMTRNKRLHIKKSKSQPSLEQQDVAKNQNKIPHSEIEKNRRQKMNKRLNDLASCLLDGLPNKNKKIDKLSILKMAVQHMKNLKASSTSVINNAFLCQSFINFQELQSLILNRTNEFLIVIKCDSGQIMYASETTFNAIGYQPKDLVDKHIFEMIHPSDIKHVKDQLFMYDSNNCDPSKNDFVPNKTYSSGNRRSFICRMQNCNAPAPEQYKVVQFMGYLNSELDSNLKYTVNHQKSSMDDESSISMEINHIINNHSTDLVQQSPETCVKFDSVQNYLIAYGTVEQESNNTPVEFMCKYDADGKFIYSESSIYSALGYVPNQLKFDSIYNIVYSEDLPKLKASFQTAAINSNVHVTTEVYRVRHADPAKPLVFVKSILFCLKNPFSGLVEYITAKNQVIPSQTNNDPLKTQTVHIPIRPTSQIESEKDNFNKPSNRISKSSSYENFPNQLNSSFNSQNNNQRPYKAIYEASPVTSNLIDRYNELDFQLNTSYADTTSSTNNLNSQYQSFQSFNLFPNQARSTSSIPATLMDETEKLAIELGFSSYDFNKRRSLPYIDRFSGFNNESNSMLCNSSLSGSNSSQNAFSGIF